MIDLQNRRCNFLLFRFEDESIIYNLKWRNKSYLYINIFSIYIDVSKKSRAMLKNLIGRMYSNLVSYSEYSQSVKVADAYDFIIKNIIYITCILLKFTPIIECRLSFFSYVVCLRCRWFVQCSLINFLNNAIRLLGFFSRLHFPVSTACNRNVKNSKYMKNITDLIIFLFYWLKKYLYVNLDRWIPPYLNLFIDLTGNKPLPRCLEGPSYWHVVQQELFRLV